jgi:para-aminobenzoate synthetase/4-amino-4-deoxychorismate lyase
MIVDMVRNDMGRIAEIGSVSVHSLFDIECYPTVFQMTSTVKSRTQASFPEIMTALFPCASITGAPKIRTMEIIKSLELDPRGIYTGCIGYLSPGRQAIFNVSIRTAVVDRVENCVEYGVGGELSGIQTAL